MPLDYNNQIARNVYCGCNNNVIFSETAIFTFTTVAVCRPVNLAVAQHWLFMPK